MKVFLDTNVLLDVLAHRQPFYRASAQIWSLSEHGDVEAYISAISFNNVYYIVRKAEDKVTADNAMRLLRDVFSSIAPDSKLINQAIGSECDDFEDAVQFHSAIRARAQFLITRDVGHFPPSKLPVVTPEEFLVIWTERAQNDP